MIKNSSMQLKSLKIEGYRGFQETVELFFDERLTILIGVNGAGKTTILDAIADFLLWLRNEVTGNEIQRYVFPPPLNGLKNYDVNNRSTHFTNLLKLAGVFENESNDTISVSITSTKNSPAKVQLNNDKSQFKAYIRQFYNAMLKGNLKHIPVLCYYGVDSISTNDLLSDKKFVASDVFDTFHNALESTRFSFKDFYNWFDKQQKIELQQGSSLFLETVKYAISEILEDEIYHFQNLRIIWGRLYDEMIIDKINKTTGNKEELVIEQLASGEKTLLALVVDLAWRLCLANPESAFPLKGNGIVLIDEIDLHLHPKWQRKVIPKLRGIFPNIQFIITTHSPIVLGATTNDFIIEKKNIRILHNNKIYQPSSSPQGRDANDILEEIMQTPKRSILIENLAKEYFKLLHRRKGETGEAQQTRQKLETLLAKDDPLFYKADAILTRQKVLSQ